MEELQKLLMLLVSAYKQGDKKAQATIKKIMEAAQQPDADELTIQIAQFIVSLLLPLSAKKGCKTKKRPLIPTKKCGDKVKKGGFGLSSNRCKCMLKRVGGTIIEVDSCTGLPFVKKGNKVVKATTGSGTEAWYNTAAMNNNNVGTMGQKHYYKEGNVWKVQTWNDGQWENAETFDPQNLNEADKTAFYQNAYAAGYDPETGVFLNQASYDAALNNKNVFLGQNIVKRVGNAEVTINPYLNATDNSLKSANGKTVVNARMLGSQKAYINNIKNQIRRTIRYSGLSFKDRLKARKEWGVNIGTKKDGNWFGQFKKDMNNAASKTANYKFTLLSLPTTGIASPLQSITSSGTQSSPHDPTKAPNYVSVGDFKTGGKLKIKLK